MMFGNVDHFPVWPDLIALWISCAGATAATILNAIAARRHPRRIARRRLALISVIASIYVVAYMILILGTVSQRDWSRVMRIVSILPWTLVWPAWAVVTIRSVWGPQDLVAVSLISDEIDRQVTERTTGP